MELQNVFDSILSWEGGSGTKKYLVSPRTVSDFFTHGIHLLRIPDYQRPYSWSKKNIVDLLNDVMKLSKKPKEASWFLGPIFIVKKSTEEKYADLLDGQQRITTIQIILREASLITLEEDGIDLNQTPEIKKKIEKAISVCKRCLIRMNNFEEIPVFETEEQLKHVFRSYILEFNDIEDCTQLKIRRKEFTEQVDKVRIEGSISARTILNTIKIVREFIAQNFIKTGKDTPTNLNNFYDFIYALVNKCWLIEIPLQNHNDSIQIFESLNNRGKSLTLVDKLRYKSLISCSDDKIDEIRNKWKEVYSGLNFVVDEKYVKDEDDFYKVFFNSIKGDDLTKEEDFIELFTKTYLDGDKKIISFLDQTLDITSFFKFLSSALDTKNNFVSKYFTKSAEQEKVKALLQLLKKTLNVSDNSRFLLFYILRNNSNYSETNYILVQSFWNIIRYVFHEEIYRNKKSNNVRTEYMDRLKKFYSGEETLYDASEINAFEYTKSMNNIIKSLNNDEAGFVLYLYAYLNDFHSLVSHNAKQYSKSQLDHFFPKAWKGYWKDKTYEKDKVIEFVKKLKIEKPELFKTINFSQFLLDIQNSENFELINYTTSPSRQEESLIEFIGNKWVLHAATNIKSSNHKFEIKKEEYKEDKWIKIPSNSDTVGMNSYSDFGYQEIIIRSLQISSGIIEKIKNSWDDI